LSEGFDPFGRLYLKSVRVLPTALLMVLPAMRHRAAERGMSGSLLIPALITGAGMLFFALGLFLIHV